jgi:dTDP-glucose 4,6-dehydratase
MLLVTGGAGFIGANFILDWLNTSNEEIINLDALTYAGNLDNLKTLQNDSRHVFVHGNILDKSLLDSLFQKYQPRAVLHFAAESHVDRSIDDPFIFLKTNVEGTQTLLTAATKFYKNLDDDKKKLFRFLHVSTDEVYGSLSKDDPAFSETTPYAPNSPYSASKAASDHFVRAWHHTYGLPTLTTNCSNNYGPYQHAEKLIPCMLQNALNGKPLPVYGDGLNVRDWLYVQDHCIGIKTVLEKGVVGETYNIGGCNEKTNLDVVYTLCDILDSVRPKSSPKDSYRNQIKFVTDRPGHDRRYAINATKIISQLGWKPKESFETGLHKTVLWYLKNGLHK